MILTLSMGNCPTTFIFDDGNAAFLCQILGNFPLRFDFPQRNKANWHNKKVRFSDESQINMED